MRIINLIPHLSGGGAERQAFCLLSRLARTGHEVHVAYIYGHGQEAAFAEAGVTLHELHCASHYSPRLVTQVMRLVCSTRPDVVHTWIPQMDVIGGLAARLTRTPWVMHEQSTGGRDYRSVKNALRKWLAHKSAVVVSNSVGGDDYWRSRLPGNTRYVIANGLPVTEIQRVRPCGLDAVGFANPGKFAIYAGRFEPGKNTRNLVTAFSMVMAEEPINAVMCGDGSLRPEVEQQIADLGLSDRIALPGYTSLIWPLMKGAELFVFASFFEGCPNVVQEAMACGCPTVLSDIPAHREIADETTTVFVDPSDPSAIAEGIRSSLAHPKEASVRAMEARARAAEWSVEKMVHRFEQVYQAVVQKVPAGLSSCHPERREESRPDSSLR